MFNRIGTFMFGVVAYGAFFATLLWFAGWIVGIGVPVPLAAPAAINTSSACRTTPVSSETINT